MKIESVQSHLLSYHLGPPLHTLVEWGELNERLAAPGPHFVVMPPEYVFAANEIVTSRKLVEVAEFKFEDAVIPVTVSIGVAALRGEIEDALEFIKQADTHLFAAKEGGRNRVVG